MLRAWTVGRVEAHLDPMHRAGPVHALTPVDLTCILTLLWIWPIDPPHPQVMVPYHLSGQWGQKVEYHLFGDRNYMRGDYSQPIV